MQPSVKNIMIQCLVISMLCLSQLANAQDDLRFIQQDMKYADLRALLIEKGWVPLRNLKIDESSLYAQEIYDLGHTEVVDCISMALDGCKFRFKQKNRMLEINTITRQLLVKSHIIKRL